MSSRVHFKSVRWKNLLSYGQNWTEVQLDAASTTLILGANGGGKSTFLDAITFCLFNRPFRKVKRELLVNSLNERDLVCETVFTAIGSEWKVVRGVKPNIFEIYRDGDMITQSSKNKDYQTFLETVVLKMSWKSFTQVVVLGSASYTPFMELTAYYRREVLEDLLDLSVFGKMSDVIRLKTSAAKTEVLDLRELVATENGRLDATEKLIARLIRQNEIGATEQRERVERLEAKAAEYAEAEAAGRQELKTLRVRTEPFVDAKEVLQKLIAEERSLQADIKRGNKNVETALKLDVCPACKQTVDKDHLNEHLIGPSQAIIENAQQRLDEMVPQIAKAKEDVVSLDGLIDEANEVSGRIRRVKDRHEHILEELSTIRNAKPIGNDIEEAEAELEALKKSAEKLAADLDDARNELRHLEAVGDLLREGGVKTRVIRNYIPLINTLVNQYLKQFDFFAQFELNEQFEETIHSRGRNAFSYYNFSEGEKLRINLALLFTWRDVARRKNSTNTNLIVLDEVADGSLDANGTRDFIRLLGSLPEGISSFVISHGVGVEDVGGFERQLIAERDGAYSQMREKIE